MTVIKRILSNLKGISAGVLLVLLGTACSSASVRTVSADGEPRMLVSCSGFFGSWEECYQRADSACDSKGYSVVQSSLERQDLQKKDTSIRELLIACSR